jgi:hypothetical protein
MNNRWQVGLANSNVDCVEAFAPSNDMIVAEARATWPDKILWINFLSTVHLQEPSAVEAATRQILEEVSSGHGFLIGVMENGPVDPDDTAGSHSHGTFFECIYSAPRQSV